MPTKAEALAELARRGLYKPPADTGPKLSEDQGKSQDFARQMATAERQYLEARRDGYNPTGPRNAFAASLEGPLPAVANWIRDDASDRGVAAQRAWLDSRLKAMTGAGESKTESDNNPKTYFPQPGEGGTYGTKYDIRREAYRSTKTRAGPAGADLPAEYPNPAQSMFQKQGQQGPKPGTVEDGYRFKGGNASDPKNWEPVR